MRYRESHVGPCDHVTLNACTERPAPPLTPPLTDCFATPCRYELSLTGATPEGVPKDAGAAALGEDVEADMERVRAEIEAYDARRELVRPPPPLAHPRRLSSTRSSSGARTQPWRAVCVCVQGHTSWSVTDASKAPIAGDQGHA